MTYYLFEKGLFPCPSSLFAKKEIHQKGVSFNQPYCYCWLTLTNSQCSTLLSAPLTFRWCHHACNCGPDLENGARAKNRCNSRPTIVAFDQRETVVIIVLCSQHLAVSHLVLQALALASGFGPWQG